MAALFASRIRTVWQAHTGLRVVWAAALLVLTATYVMADGGYPIVVDASALLTGQPCVSPYSVSSRGSKMRLTTRPPEQPFCDLGGVNNFSVRIWFQYYRFQRLFTD